MIIRPASELMLKPFSSLAIGELVRDSTGRENSTGVVVSVGNERAFLSLTGEDPFCFWQESDETPFLSLVEPKDIYIRFDDESPRFDSVRQAGSITLTPTGAMLTARMRSQGLHSPVYFRLADWSQYREQLAQGFFLTVFEWGIGKMNNNHEYIELFKSSGRPQQR